MPRLDSKLGKVEGALMELPIPMKSIDAGLPVLGGAVGKSPGPEANGLFARRFFGIESEQRREIGVVPEPAGGITFVGRRATGMTSITLSWKLNSSFLVSRGRVASSSFSCWHLARKGSSSVQKDSKGSGQSHICPHKRRCNIDYTCPPTPALLLSSSCAAPSFKMGILDSALTPYSFKERLTGRKRQKI